MINKKLKSYLEYKIVHPKPCENNQALLKLKAFQKSRQKYHQRNPSLQKSTHTHKHSQSFTETAHSTFIKSKSPEKPNHKHTISSMNSQIRELQQKVDILLSDKTPQKMINVSRSNRILEGKRSAQKRYSNDRRTFTENSSLMKNQKLRESFMNSITDQCSDQRTRTRKQSGYKDSGCKDLIVLKMEACKLLTNLDIEPRRLDFFENAKSTEELFQMLQNILSISFAQMIIDNSDSVHANQQQYIASLKVQSQRIKLHSKHLQYQISQIRKQRTCLQQSISSLKHQIQQKQTQIYQLSMLHTQTQNQLLSQSLSHQSQLSTLHTTLKLQYQKQIYQKINKIHHKELLQTKLQQYLHKQIQNNSTLEFDNNVLLMELEKWERECIRLRERYQMEKCQKMGIEEERNLEMEVYEEFRGVMRDGYFGLVEKLGQEIVELRKSQKMQEEQILGLKNKMKSQNDRVKEYQNDYLCLNQDYTRDVRQWVAKQQYYEKTIKQLRHQVQEAHETIAQYSKMLATSVIKNSILDSTQND